MNKLRENTGVVLWILVIAFGIVWVLQDSGAFDNIGQQPRDIAVVNGQSISYEEYQNALQQQQNQMREQTGGEIPPRMLDMLRERTYTSLVNNALMEQEMDRLGITVTDDEVMDMVYGPTPDPFIRQQFSDSTGQVNRQLINNVAQNPETRQSWIQIEQYLRNKRRSQKMNNLVAATVHVSEQEVLDTYRRRNRSASVRYVSQRYTTVPNDSITVTEDDLRAYYDDNRNDFERPKTYSLDYVTLSRQPSSEDSSAVLNDLNQLRDEFAATDNDSLFLAENASQRDFSSSFSTADELEGPVASAIYPDPEPGAIVGPIVAGQAAHLVKVLDTRPAEEVALHARHILLQSSSENEQFAQQAREIVQQLEEGADFAALARQYSDDQGSTANGGDLGWFARGRMVEAFEEAAFNADVGEIVGPVKSRFGYHIIEVLDRAEEAVQIADMAYTLRPSNATLSDIKYTLEDIAYFAEEQGSFAEEAEAQNLNPQQVEVEADQSSIPGLGQSSTITTFLESAEEGAISNVIELNDQFAVIHVRDIQEAGYRPFEDVKNQIRPRVELQKKKAIVTERMQRAFQNGNLEQLANALGTSIRTNSDVTFETNVVSGLGREPAFAGTVFGLEEGETSSVVEGQNAAFVVEVTSFTEPPAITDAQREEIRQELLNQRRQQVSNEWITSLRDRAEIQDNRSVFRQ